ncbi:DNA-binding protein [Moraxella sp. FZLJ2107]|uniref:helix-turn-helix domain-containing protein n=1 Tax=unclassified Moraxella TaxID=2685852 RepID=UPI00209C47B7|nr:MULTISPECIES: helix-turn-helix domain-containing protein [unclassified Moraxella]USZ15187.1 DNA-binding protein [Moraxella sp. FZFQ2102]UTO05909.1 DNA-binding protein [Moraxella sp. FZLJ2107]UTO22645.1 DNA-binding protein [Moraxella sp. FZLJ2109]
MSSKHPTDTTPLHLHVERAVQRYFEGLEGEDTDNLYNIFLAELERPLLATTLKYARGNQSKTAQLLGLNRGTLRTKLKAHGLL